MSTGLRLGGMNDRLVDVSGAARLLGLAPAAVRRLAAVEASFPEPGGDSTIDEPTWEYRALIEWRRGHRETVEQLKMRHDT